MTKFIIYSILLLSFMNKVSAQDGFVYIRLTNDIEEKSYNYYIYYNGDTIIKSSYVHSYIQYAGIYLHLKKLNKSTGDIVIEFEGGERLTLDPNAIKKLKVLDLYWGNKYVSMIDIKSPKVKLRKLKKGYNTIINLKTGKVTKKSSHKKNE